MKIKETVFTLALLTSCFVYAQKGIQASCHPTMPPEIDGKVEDWSVEWQKDSDNKFWYNVCNDEENLYIRLKISDGMTQVKTARFGLTVWLDPNGKKKRKFGLKYPTPEGRDFTQIEKVEDSRDDKRTQDQKRLDMKRELIKDTEVLELFGLAKEKIISSRLGLMNGIKVIIDMDNSGAYLYEAKIPFKAYKIDKASLSTLGIGFETGKLTMVASSANIASQRQYGSGFGGGISGGQRGGGTPYSPMAAETRLWIVVKLN